MLELSKRAQEKLHKKLTGKKKRLEQHEDVIRWRKWIDMTPNEKSDIRIRWDEYYKKAWSTKAAKIWQKTREAANRQDWATVGECAVTAKAWLLQDDHELTDPTSVDPYFLEHREAVRQYAITVDLIRKLEEEDEDILQAESVFL